MATISYICIVFIEIFDMSINYKDIKTKEEFDEALAEYMAKNPALKKAKPVECLNLIMRKQFAQQIVDGTKKVEFRAFSQHYVDRLIDQDVDNWMTDHVDDEEAMFFANHVRPVKKIHFHNYNNSWSLDVECVRNDYCAPCQKDIDFLHEKWDCHELDEMCKDFDRKKATERPMFFFFVVGKILNKQGL
jgi:hypothetical protein